MLQYNTHPLYNFMKNYEDYFYNQDPYFYDLESSISSLQYNLYANDKELLIMMPFAGIEKKDLQLSLDDDFLTLEKLQPPNNDKKETFYQQKIALPCKVKSENMKASLQDGILEITLQKKEKTEPKKITIK